MSYRQNKLVDEYIAQFSGETRERLVWLRAVMQATFPDTVEDISYGMPTYRTAPGKRGLVHFATTKDHLGIYGVFDPKNDSEMHRKMNPYRTGRGTLQFQHNEKLPRRKIRQILAHHASKVDQ